MRTAKPSSAPCLRPPSYGACVRHSGLPSADPAASGLHWRCPVPPPSSRARRWCAWRTRWRWTRRTRCVRLCPSVRACCTPLLTRLRWAGGGGAAARAGSARGVGDAAGHARLRRRQLCLLTAPQPRLPLPLPHSPLPCAALASQWSASFEAGASGSGTAAAADTVQRIVREKLVRCARPCVTRRVVVPQAPWLQRARGAAVPPSPRPRPPSPDAAGSLLEAEEEAKGAAEGPDATAVQARPRSFGAAPPAAAAAPAAFSPHSEQVRGVFVGLRACPARLSAARAEAAGRAAAQRDGGGGGGGGGGEGA